MLIFQTEKYYDLYDYQAEDGVGYSRYSLGDATREILKDASSQGQNAWWDDYSYSIYEASPWIYRGAASWASSGAGVQTFNRRSGANNTGYSFRSVLTAP